mmetsp:Transcript_51879/g.110242  ORF Transcript_51879/g.110242 Transcript_51879/m.110242 type:complete len:562 (-) Transcript_51879:98-1783(-)
MPAMVSPFAFSAMVGVESASSAPPDLIVEQMAAGAFRSLCEHLRIRSDEVQNMDLMTIGGFCRNCLAKWMVVEARKLKQVCLDDSDIALTFTGSGIAEPKRSNIQDLTLALDCFGYDDAAKEVYGITYPEWKKRHQKKATEEQLRLYKKSTHLHAAHDSELLKTILTGAAAVNYPSKRAMVCLQAGAFLSLCHHLRDRSDEVQNMELMTVSGFCRNCLAKWLVVEARNISDRISADNEMASFFPEQQRRTLNSLDSFGYDEAAQYVYGCNYPEWKKRHQKKATGEQLERYNESKRLHAKHDKEMLATRSSFISSDKSNSSGRGENKQLCIKEPTQQSSLLSDVCCQDVETLASPTGGVTQSTIASREIPRPPRGDLKLKVGILTVSDRAASNAYESGDLSGPAVEMALTGQIDQTNSNYKDQNIAVTHIEKQIVADEIPDIKGVLLHWSGKATGSKDEAESPSQTPYDLIFTTGGTGFARRDITPEATLSVLDRDCQGLMSWASMELAGTQPLATLSRAVAGTCGDTLIVNLPGNPTGAAQVLNILFPLLIHAIKDLRGSC